MPTTPPISRPTLAFFRYITRRYFRRHFHAVRITNPHILTTQPGPLIIYANHTSWWDPMVSTLLASKLLPQKSHYAPMDAVSLARYRILSRIGIFPIDLDSARGAVQLLRTAAAIFETNGILWITPQGRFADPRERPLAFKPGLAALAARHPNVPILPLAIEYPFWTERLPEVLLHFGAPLTAASDAQLESALLTTMNDLATLSIARDPRAFTTLFQGGSGAGGIYHLGRKLWARLRNKPFQSDHVPPPDAPENQPRMRS